jgi:hypothetical protein
MKIVCKGWKRWHIRLAKPYGRLLIHPLNLTIFWGYYRCEKHSSGSIFQVSVNGLSIIDGIKLARKKQTGIG